ncbi:peptidylprolyl isomerase [Methyloglobulus sp.]|jgi:peptidyl-prolyl cis-trans isomerase SurA|uniref:peptidylprolyl isomerase n=1 Tax=Methyloglobulus sp. TaxID=2518622 RepID=UPI0032B8718D
MMYFNVLKKPFSYLVLLFGLIVVSHNTYAEVLDRMVANVEGEAILESELQREIATIVQRIQASNTAMPPDYVLKKQVLEKIIVEKLQRQLAEKAGINLSEEMLNNSATDIAQRNNMTLEQFKQELQKQGLSYQSFQDNMHNEIIINQLRGREIGDRIKVTDREIEHFIETEDKGGEGMGQYHLGHILIAVKEGASSSVIQKAKNKADELVKALRSGQDFTKTAISDSEDENALKGGDLGWQTKNDVATFFVDAVSKMKEGDVSDPIRSPSGFHIIKMLEMKGVGAHTITKSKVRHILIKTNELIDDAEAQKRLLALKQRMVDGDDFATLARAHSDDKGSALKGGSLDWVGPDDLVKPFQEAMEKLAINEISEPVQTQFGWHLIQVLERESKDNTNEFKKNQIRDIIRKRKIEEETELWLRRLRDESSVEIYQDRL